MKITGKLCWMWIGALIALNSFTEGAQKFVEDSPIKISKPFEIKNWTQKEIFFDIPAFGIEHQVQLEFEVCAPYKKQRASGGSNPVLTLSVNGNSVSDKQMLGQPNSFQYNGTTELTWTRGNRFRVLYGQNFEIVPSVAAAYPETKNPYRYVVDITSFAKSGQENKIIFDYNHSYKDITLKARNLNIVITKNLMHPVVDEEVLPAPAGTIPVKAIRGKTQESANVFLADSGAISVDFDSRKHTLLTKTTIPGGGWKTTALSKKGQTLTQDATGSVSWKTPFYTVERQVAVLSDHIMVSDTIQNTTSRLIGVRLENWMEHTEDSATYLLGGREKTGDARVEETENPTACIQFQNSAIGIMPESDIFQAHLSLFKKGSTVGLADQHLGIESGQRVTMKWSIYPVVNGGYWDMVNAIRRNWGVNFTISGPFAFRSIARMLGREGRDEYVQWVKGRNLKRVCDSIPVYNAPDIARFSQEYGDKGRYTKYAHGTAALLGTDFIQNVETVRSALQEDVPDMDYFFYFHAQISTEENGPELYKDSIVRAKDGTPLYYATDFLKMYIPMRTNAYEKALWKYVELVVDQTEMNMYWDEMSYSQKRMVYGVDWDGCTIELDSRFNVAGKMTCVPLAMQPFKLKVLDYLKSKGKEFIGNGQASTPTMRQQKLVRFVETASYDNICKTHVGSIIGLSTHHPEKSPVDSYNQVCNFLKRGALYYSNWSIPNDTIPEDYFIQYMFPTTPIEIYAGTIFAKERIITCNSGIYTLPGKKQAKIVVVGPKGLLVDSSEWVKESKIADGYEYEIRIPSNYIAILIGKRV